VVTAGIYHERPAAPLVRPAPALVPAPDVEPQATLLALLGRPNLASREFVYRGYDTDVRGPPYAPGEGTPGDRPGSGRALRLAIAVTARRPTAASIPISPRCTPLWRP